MDTNRLKNVYVDINRETLQELANTLIDTLFETKKDELVKLVISELKYSNESKTESSVEVILHNDLESKKEELRKLVISEYDKYSSHLTVKSERGKAHIEECVGMVLFGGRTIEDVKAEVKREYDRMRQFEEAVWCVRHNNGIAYFSSEDADEDLHHVYYAIRKDASNEDIKRFANHLIQKHSD